MENFCQIPVPCCCADIGRDFVGKNFLYRLVLRLVLLLCCVLVPPEFAPCFPVPFTHTFSASLQAVIIFKSATYENPTAPGYVYPDWALALGWLMVAFTMFWIPTMAVVEVALQFKKTRVRAHPFLTSGVFCSHGRPCTGSCAAGPILFHC